MRGRHIPDAGACVDYRTICPGRCLFAVPAGAQGCEGSLPRLDAVQDHHLQPLLSGLGVTDLHGERDQAGVSHQVGLDPCAPHLVQPEACADLIACPDEHVQHRVVADDAGRHIQRLHPVDPVLGLRDVPLFRACMDDCHDGVLVNPAPMGLHVLQPMLRHIRGTILCASADYGAVDLLVRPDVTTQHLPEPVLGPGGAAGLSASFDEGTVDDLVGLDRGHLHLHEPLFRLLHVAGVSEGRYHCAEGDHARGVPALNHPPDPGLRELPRSSLRAHVDHRVVSDSIGLQAHLRHQAPEASRQVDIRSLGAGIEERVEGNRVRLETCAHHLCRAPHGCRSGLELRAGMDDRVVECLARAALVLLYFVREVELRLL
mmetsp:Transcript_424/g.1036  ORF Transcript_424/g.1036 Transcript_424/m.1036 type:complete len:373 (-) Transcript_424:235-1353(-)